MVKIALKWGKEKFDLDLDPTENLLDFKAKIYAVTSVPVDKQKLIFKGNVLKVHIQRLLISIIILFSRKKLI